MANIVKSADKLIGKTPLLELDNFAKAYDVPATILGKLEYLNPTGSVKDRAALYMINDAEKAGRLKPGGTIIEPTSGNTGIGIASVGAARGYKVIIVMPETMTKERRDMISAYGADIVLTDGKSGMSGAVAKAKVNEIEGSIILSQFENPSNAQAHYETTGPEIWDDTDGKVDIFIAGVGTGGTVTGVGKYLKEKNPNVKIVAVEPQTSPVLSGGKPGPHKIQGIGAGFVPHLYTMSVTIAFILLAALFYPSARVMSERTDMRKFLEWLEYPGALADSYHSIITQDCHDNADNGSPYNPHDMNHQKQNENEK